MQAGRAISMQPPALRSLFLRYGAALGAVAVTAGARLSLDPLLRDRAPTLPFTIAVMLAAWYGGLGPGLFATVTSGLLVAVCWLAPMGSSALDTAGNRLELSLFALIGVAISVLNQSVHNARLRAEARAAELRERENEHRRLLETAAEGIWTLDREGMITFANRSMAEMLGRPHEALAGRSVYEFFEPALRSEIEERLRAILGGERVGHEVRLQRSDGATIWAHASSAPVTDGRGATVGAVSMFTDVSARRLYETELQRLLDSEKKARGDAEAANRAKDDFLATVSHELRTPLNAMLGWLTMLRSGALDASKTSRAIEVIERNARSQAKLIEDLLDVSRMISGKLRLELKRVSIGGVVQSALDAIGPTAAAKQIRIEKNVDPDIDGVAGDPERLKQIVVNLLSNALKFTPPGGKVTVELSHRAPDGLPDPGVVELRVIDTGQGIAREFLPHVFDRFRQQDAGMTRKHAGLGLGLAIVRHLVELHGGTVRAESAGPGKGSRFVVTLPALDAATAATLPSTPALTEAPDLRPPSASLRGARVLVVDDELDSLDMLRELLERAGAQVKTASSAAAAFPIVREWSPDLVLSDLAMPEEDGYDLLARVRALPADRGGSTRAIALTAHARLTDRIRVLSSGFQAYLAKPVEPEELLATARRVLTSPPSAASAHP
jgi:PAS domain S-box-containing protein